jgi:cyclin B
MKTSHNSNLCSLNINKNHKKNLLTNKKNIKNNHNLLNNSNNYKYKTNNNSSLNLKNIKNKEDDKFINDIQNKIKEIKLSNNKSYTKIFPIINPFPQYVSEYSEEIYKNLLIDEKKFISKQIIDFLYMNNQEQINKEMRSILINWLIEVQDKFNYTEQTLFLTISLIDRYSSFKKILRSEYQLVGIACLFIACKHEEIELPNSKDFLFITENAYTKEELFNMEYKILKPINFEILTSTQYDFFLSFCNKFKFNQNEINYGKYLLNLTLLDYDLLKYSNSIIANSCAIISKKYFEKDNDKIKELYNKELYNESLIEDAGLINCIKDIKDLYLNFNKGEYMNARNKFMREKFGNIINIIEAK